jgi:hypothetical protein
MPRLFTYEEAAQQLNCSVGWLKKRVAAPRCPISALG